MTDKIKKIIKKEGLIISVLFVCAFVGFLGYGYPNYGAYKQYEPFSSILFRALIVYLAIVFFRLIIWRIRILRRKKQIK